MYLISPSKLDQFRSFIQGDYNGKITEADVISYIKGEKKFAPQMTRGTAYHAIIEHGPNQFYDASISKYAVKVGDMPEVEVFTKDQVYPVRDYLSRYPLMIREVSLRSITQINGEDVLIPMRVDGINGNIVHEVKTSKYPSKYRTYENKLQWKLYALATKTPYVQYDTFCIGDKESDNVSYKPLQYIASHDQLIKDVKYWLGFFIQFITDKDLIQYVRKN